MMDRETGLPITEDEHIIQSLFDITFTAKGSRVMRRHYGTIFVPKIDAPMNDEYRMVVMSSLVMAYTEYEPRIEVRSIKIDLNNEGKPSLFLEAVKRKDGELLSGNIMLGGV